MSGFKVLFLATAPFAVPSLQILAQSEFCPTAVVTRPDRPAGRGKRVLSPPVKNTASDLGLQVLQPVGKRELFQVLEQIQPGILVNVAYGMILPSYILEYPLLGCINVHPSLLPAYRGAAPVRRAIMAGDRVTGVTVMFMADEMDAGDIIVQENTFIAEDETYGMLHDRLALMGAGLLVKALKMVVGGSAPRIPQNEEEATYAPSLSPEDELIKWVRTADEIYNHVRGMEPSPGVYTWFRGKRLKVRKVIQAGEKDMSSKTKESLSPGMVCSIGKDSFQVVTGQGCLKVLELQPEGKKRISAGDFLRGYNLQVGEKLG